MKKIIIVLISVLGFISCNNQEKEEFETNNDALFFEEILSAIPEIKLPYNLYCGIGDGVFPCPYLFVEDLGENAMKLFPENSMIVGKMPINNDNTYIIYGLPGDIIYPYLNIYDKNGQKIDSLYLHISYCTGDDEELVTTATTINKDFSIHMTDTIQYHRDIGNNEDYEWIIDSVIVSTRKMDLMKDGYYKITKETTHKVNTVMNYNRKSTE